MTKPKSPTASHDAAPSKASTHQAEAWTSIFDMPLDELSRRTEQASVLMTQTLQLFPGLLSMTADERKHSTGRLRSGEGVIYLDIISVIEAFPAFFQGLADLDEGVDPTKVETDLMRDRVQRAEALAPVAGLVEQFVGISDTVLHLRSLVRQPVTEAYGIAKSLARTNAALKSKLARAIDYYASIGKAAAASRKANATAKQTGNGGAKG